MYQAALERLAKSLQQLKKLIKMLLRFVSSLAGCGLNAVICLLPHTVRSQTDRLILDRRPIFNFVLSAE